MAFGTRLPSGAVARVCDLPGGRLGKQVEKIPARGRGYKLIDSNPGSSAPFYLTWSDDNCARIFTAALALFGSPTMHEQLRYGLPSKVQPYSLTDKAYEGIKRSVCGVGKNNAFGAKINKLKKTLCSFRLMTALAATRAGRIFCSTTIGSLQQIAKVKVKA